MGSNPTDRTIKHPRTIPGYTSENLAESLGNLHYEELARFLHSLANKIQADSLADAKRGRRRLAQRLSDTATFLRIAASNTDLVWNICKPYMREE